MKNQQQQQYSSGNMMEMVKSQLMAMTMMSSMNHNASNSTTDSNPMWNMALIGAATFIIDFALKYVPIIANRIAKHYSEKIENSSISKLIHTEDSVNKKTASITITINTTETEDLLGLAVLYQLTNNTNTRYIVHQSKNFILDQLTEIEMVPSIYGILHKTRFEQPPDKQGTTIQTIEIFSRVKTLPELRTYLAKISHDYEIEVKNKIGNKIYFFGQVPVNAPKTIEGNCDFTKLPPNFTFTMKEFHTNRKFSNLFGPEIDLVRKRVQFFMANESWYAEKGIPYTLGVLLSGQAGAGKTSTIKCLAHETKRHIININLNNDMTKTQLEGLFFNETVSVLNHQTMQKETFYIPLDRRIYVLEDIDCQSDIVYERNPEKQKAPETNEQLSPSGLSAPAPAPALPGPALPGPIAHSSYNPIQSNVKNVIALKKCNDAPTNKVDLSFLLNLLDGVLETPGRIVIMTCNYPEKLDHALVRPGRVDVTAKFKKCSSATIVEMIEFFYNIELPEDTKLKIMTMNDFLISPAEMGKYMFEDFDDYNKLINTLLDKFAQSNA